MSRRITGRALEDLGKVFTVGAIGRLSDGELLARFLDRDGKGAEEAFAALVERHGPTVLTVCRRMLGDTHEADDAFQATFLVLARRAASVSGRDRVGNWLYGVALRVSQEARRRADRRRRRERLLGDEAGSIPSSFAVAPDPSVEELRRLIVEELARLPDRYRGPLLLCDLEGRSRREAADRLGLPEGTLSSRLARGRDLLRGRLVRRGLAPSTSIAAMGRPASAFVPASLVRRSVEAAWLATTRGLAAGTVPVAVSGLAGEVLRTMFVFKLTAGLAAVGLAATVAFGAAWAIGPRERGPVVEELAVDALTVEPPSIAKNEPTEGESGDGPIARGVVVDEEGRPVEGAEVTLVIPGRSYVIGKTDTEGRFAMNAQRPNLGERPVVASIDGGRRLGYAVYDWQKARDGEEELLRVVLKPSREVILRAEDGEGQPVEGATVEVIADLTSIVQAQTDEQGQAVVRLPAEAPITWAFGLKSGIGFDYAELSPRENQGIPATELPDEVVLALDGARTVQVKAVDRRGEPLEGIRVYTWVIAKPGKRDSINLGGARSVFKVTGADGIASYDWIPAETTQPISVMNGAEDYHAPDRALIAPELPSGETVVAEFVRKGAIRGRVTHADGSPAGGITILASGMGSGFDNSSRLETRTEEDGTYELAAEATQCYMIGVVDEIWAAPSRAGIIVEEGEEVEGIDFTLSGGAIIRGTVTLGPDDWPVPDANVYLREDGGMMPEGLKREGDIFLREVSLGRWARTDERGAFRARVGPGTYSVGGLARTDMRTVEAVEGGDYEVDFRMPRPERGPLAGRVALASDPSQGVEGAIIDATPTEPQGLRMMTVTSGPDGHFKADRPLDRLEIIARSADGTLGGIITSPANEKEVTILIGPLASATGIALDEQGEPIADQDLDFVRVVRPEGYTGSAHRAIPGPKVTTDAEGRFTMGGMVIGCPYRLSLKRGNGYHPLIEFTPTEPGLTDLGTLRLEESRTRVRE
ncbi:sigma-70 family RNA polymerase sigma factor [Tautonia marina]|uniref:sigma-70 family RNA polymerase sigma factor n=1 Tax=Tautonia marina TaxID=2653855 RepID=UPI0012604A52|nr:sigma-70 family RNA polymerase sigma factor [Tautonia marina]